MRKILVAVVLALAVRILLPGVIQLAYPTRLKPGYFLSQRGFLHVPLD